MYKNFLPFCFALFAVAISTTSAQNVVINGPTGSGEFGKTTTVLSNGNYVVTDPFYNNATTGVGAVHLYNGKTHTIISTLTGSAINDQIGNGGVIAFANGNYLVISTIWDNGAITNAGAVTWCNGITGRTGIVSSTNSLVGSSAGDQVGVGGITILNNGNYVVSSPLWDNGAVTNAGAVTWCNGVTGRTGALSDANSLVGTSTEDRVGNAGITVLSNGNYVVRSGWWDNGANTDAGAVTWCNAAIGRVGEVSDANSLVGSSSNDQIGIKFITVLGNGNFVLNSEFWDNGIISDAGAITWCDGTLGLVGQVSSTNSLVGSSADDRIGSGGITVLTNGNYVINSPLWNNGVFDDVGAVTWCNKSLGLVGTVSATNSLVGSFTYDVIGSAGITALSNGNYVVKSRDWNNGAMADVGAATWCSGISGRVGPVSTSNSLYGSSANDQVGNSGVTALSNGNYVVFVPLWNNGAVFNAGALTWCDGTSGRVGPVSTSNSLIGATANDFVGSGGITALSNGNYVINSPGWDNGATSNVGAITWCDGSTGSTGVVDVTNSLVGSSASDQIGSGGITVLNNGNYLITSPLWDNGANADAGAVTWCNGNSGRIGAVNTANSLVGSSTSDMIGSSGITVLNNGNYIVKSGNWANGAITNAGAATWCDGAIGRIDVVSVSNSLIGSSSGDAISSGGVAALSNGNYVVISPLWDGGANNAVGAVTWCNGAIGKAGVVSAANSIIGSSSNDNIGNIGVSTLTNGNFIIYSTKWDNGAISNAGAITIASDNSITSGVINTCNSVLGVIANPNPMPFYVHNSIHDYLIVSKPAENKIVIRNYPQGSSFSQTICANQSFFWNGSARNIAGAYKATFISFTGCDSVVTLNLVVKPTSSSSFNQTICANQSFLWNGIARNTSGAFKDTFTSFNGCDSVVTLNLTVTPLPSKLTNTTGNTITAAQAGATYQWINCATNTAINGENAQSFTPSSNGNYKVVITLNNCSDTSACVPINSVGINQNNLSTHIQIYPNPARESLTVSLSDEDFNASIILLSLDGKKIQTYPLNQKTNTLPISHLAPGFYLYEISFRGNIEKGKLLIEE